MAYSNRDNYARWYANNLDKIRKYKREKMKELRSKNPEHYRAYQKGINQRMRENLFDIYGRVCVKCGYSDIRVLTLDHVLNNGAEERKVLGERGVYRRALKVEHRTEYRTLCMNCQFISRIESNRQNQHG